MTHDQDWRDLLPRIRARWPQLTEAELEPTRGERGALVALVHQVIGGDQQALSREIDLLLADDPSAEAHGPGSMPLRADASTGAMPDAEMAEEYAKGDQASERIDEGPVIADAGPNLPSTAAQQPEVGDQHGQPPRDEPQRRAG